MTTLNAARLCSPLVLTTMQAAPLISLHSTLRKPSSSSAAARAGNVPPHSSRRVASSSPGPARQPPHQDRLRSPKTRSVIDVEVSAEIGRLITLFETFPATAHK